MAANGIDSHPSAFPGDARTSHVRQYPIISNESSMDERMGVDFLLDNGQRPVDPALIRQPYTVFESARHAPLLDPFTTLPRYISPTCPLDALCQDFMSEMQSRERHGTSAKDLAGPPYPNYSALLNSNRKGYIHPLSKLHTDIIRTFPDISGLPEQVAIIYIMFLVMRWLIHPTRENYERMPEWMQPRPIQLFVPHPFWNGYIPW